MNESQRTADYSLKRSQITNTEYSYPSKPVAVEIWTVRSLRVQTSEFSLSKSEFFLNTATSSLCFAFPISLIFVLPFPCFRFIYSLTYLHYLRVSVTNLQHDQLPVGLISQLVEHFTGIAEAMGSNPVQA